METNYDRLMADGLRADNKRLKDEVQRLQEENESLRDRIERLRLEGAREQGVSIGRDQANRQVREELILLIRKLAGSDD